MGRKRRGRTGPLNKRVRRDSPNRFTVDGPGGEKLEVKGTIEFECPFCGGNVVVSEEPQAVMHSVPMCEKFDAEEPLVFLRNARVAAFGPEPDDDEWPIPLPNGKGSN